MSKGTEVISKMIENKIGEVHTALPAKVLKYDHKKMIAKVQLLNKKHLEGEQVKIPPIVEVPVLHGNFGNFVIRPGFKKDDIVQVLFNERALDKILMTGEAEEVKFTRKHSYDDAVIVGGLKTEQEDDLPDEESESYYICNVDKDVKIYLNPDGTVRIANDKKQVEIVMEPDGVIRIADNKNGTELKFDINSAGDAIFKLANKLFLGSSGASEGVPLGDSLKDWLDNHTHSGVSTGTSSSGTPNSSSPNPSEKVLVE